MDDKMNDVIDEVQKRLGEEYEVKERNATCIQMNGDFARQKFRALQQLW